MKNKELIISNIGEAKEQLEEIIRNLEADSEYSEIEFQLSLEHAYHHLNYAWHIRHVEETRAVACSQSDFKEWSKFPVHEITEFE